MKIGFRQRMIHPLKPFIRWEIVLLGAEGDAEDASRSGQGEDAGEARTCAAVGSPPQN